MIDDLGSKPSARRPALVGAGTLRNVRACLRAALSAAVRPELVPRNVAMLVELPTVKRPKSVAVATARLARFLTHVEDDPLSPLWLADAVYGMRRGELAGLRWPDVDEGAHIIRIRQGLIQVPGS
jgi:integrase